MPKKTDVSELKEQLRRKLNDTQDKINNLCTELEIAENDYKLLKTLYNRL